jgi:hypothetical protein
MIELKICLSDNGNNDVSKLQWGFQPNSKQPFPFPSTIFFKPSLFCVCFCSLITRLRQQTFEVVLSVFVFIENIFYHLLLILPPSLSTMSSTEPSSFVPKRNVTAHVGKETVHVHPDLASEMSVSEKSCGFTVTKNALEAVDSPVRAKLQVLAGCTSTTPLSATLRARFIKHALDRR